MVGGVPLPALEGQVKLWFHVQRASEVGHCHSDVVPDAPAKALLPALPCRAQQERRGLLRAASRARKLNSLLQGAGDSRQLR